MTILEFTTKAEADAALAFIKQLAIDYFTQLGYTIINGELIGKNAKTGNDEPDAPRTTHWDIAQESPDGTWYFRSLTGTRFAGAMDDLAANFTFTERELPAEWMPEQDDPTII